MPPRELSFRRVELADAGRPVMAAFLNPIIARVSGESEFGRQHATTIAALSLEIKLAYLLERGYGSIVAVRGGQANWPYCLPRP